MPFFGGVAQSLSIYKNLHTMVAAKASADDGVVMGQGPFSMKYFLSGALAGGIVVELTAPIKFDHRSEFVEAGGKHVDARCSVGLLSRSITIEADVAPTSKQRYGMSLRTFDTIDGWSCLERGRAGWSREMKDFKVLVQE